MPGLLDLKLLKLTIYNLQSMKLTNLLQQKCQIMSEKSSDIDWDKNKVHVQ